jgi:hypothetical protein
MTGCSFEERHFKVGDCFFVPGSPKLYKITEKGDYSYRGVYLAIDNTRGIFRTDPYELFLVNARQIDCFDDFKDVQ